MAHRLESDLYEPIAAHLRDVGYDVRGEVRGVDVVALRDDELVGVELKLRMGLDLILQAVERQRSLDAVYVAVEAPPAGFRRRNKRRIYGLLRRLEVGLIVVHFNSSGPSVDVQLPPRAHVRRRSQKERRLIIKEFTGRSGDRNLGGSAARQVVTAYREQSIFIASALLHIGTASPADLRRVGTGDKTQSILSRNVYGWFARVDRGQYAIEAEGRTAVAEYPDVFEHYGRIVKDCT